MSTVAGTDLVICHKYDLLALSTLYMTSLESMPQLHLEITHLKREVLVLAIH